MSSSVPVAASFAAGVAVAVAVSTLVQRAVARVEDSKAASARVDSASSGSQSPTPVQGAAPVEHFPVTHLDDLFGAGETFPSPLLSRTWPKNLNFVSRGAEWLESQALTPGGTPSTALARAFLVAGPPERLAHDPAHVSAAIVTCGGLCPGLNTVIREITMCLFHVYKVDTVWGVPNGYRGFYGTSPWRVLTPDSVSEIHHEGGTVLGSSRGGFDGPKILDALEARGINLLFVIGGDGTHRGALELLHLATSRRMKLSIAGVPKTIDNDIPLVEKSFGFDTAVEEAVRPIQCANVEAEAAQNGVGLVKLMGRAAGFIATHASMASRDVNLTLIPEAPWRLSKLLEWLEVRLAERGHAVIVVAEGAESIEVQEAKAAKAKAAAAGDAGGKKDESGNAVFDDVGLYLKDAIQAHFKAKKNPANIKYIDPSYIIRSAPPCASDSNMCSTLAFNAVHGAMAGYTGFTVSTVDGHFILLPIQAVSIRPPRILDTTGRLYARLCTCTGQPSLV